MLLKKSSVSEQSRGEGQRHHGRAGRGSAGWPRVNPSAWAADRRGRRCQSRRRARCGSARAAASQAAPRPRSARGRLDERKGSKADAREVVAWAGLFGACGLTLRRLEPEAMGAVPVACGDVDQACSRHQQSGREDGGREGWGCAGWAGGAGGTHRRHSHRATRRLARSQTRPDRAAQH